MWAQDWRGCASAGVAWIKLSRVVECRAQMWVVSASRPFTCLRSPTQEGTARLYLHDIFAATIERSGEGCGGGWVNDVAFQQGEGVGACHPRVI